jgi:hypothetical protein
MITNSRFNKNWQSLHQWVQSKYGATLNMLEAVTLMMPIDPATVNSVEQLFSKMLDNKKLNHDPSEVKDWIQKKIFYQFARIITKATEETVNNGNDAVIQRILQSPHLPPHETTLFRVAITLAGRKFRVEDDGIGFGASGVVNYLVPQRTSKQTRMDHVTGIFGQGGMGIFSGKRNVDTCF